jgi:hypothetical protein
LSSLPACPGCMACNGVLASRRSGTPLSCRDRPYDDMPDEAEEARRKSRRRDDSSPAAARSGTQQYAPYATASTAVQARGSAPYRVTAALSAGPELVQRSSRCNSRSLQAVLHVILAVTDPNHICTCLQHKQFGCISFADSPAAWQSPVRISLLSQAAVPQSQPIRQPQAPH